MNRQYALAMTTASLIMLAGCGSTVAPPVTTQHAPGPSAGSRAEAASAARRLLAGLVLPPGARRLPDRPLPPGLQQAGERPGGAQLVDEFRLYKIPLTTGAAAAFLRSHRPPGTTVGDTGSGKFLVPLTILDFRTAPRHLLAGLYDLELVGTIAAEPGGSTVLRADAFAIWYPPRSAAEHLAAARFRAVRVSILATRPLGSSTLVSSRHVIAAITDRLNGLHAAPAGMVLSCPAMVISYRLTLEPAVSDQAAVTIVPSNCMTDSVTVGGHAQPPLWDPGARLYRLAAALAHPLHPAPGTQPG